MTALTIDRARYRVHVGKKEVFLAPKEIDLLFALMDADGKPVSRKDLAAKLYEPDWAGAIDHRAIDQHIARLRRKIKPVSAVRTVVGRGYQYIED